jgi:hypothetical protein
MHIHPKIALERSTLFPDNFDSRQQTAKKKAPLMSNDVTYPNVPAAACFCFELA